MCLFNSLLFGLFVFLTILTVGVAAYFHKCYNFWTKNGVPVVPPQFPLGNANVYFPRSLSLGILSKHFYDYLKRQGHKFGGVYLITRPNLVIVDPDFVKAILCKDFGHFVDRGFYYNRKHDAISANLFALDGLEWKNLRTKLSPTFTPNKVRMMFEELKKHCHNLIVALNATSGADVDIKEMLCKYTIDSIGSCAFGIDCNSFKSTDSEFQKISAKMFQFNWRRSIRAFFIANLPQLSLKLGLCGNNKDIIDFFTQTVVDAIKMRSDSEVKRNDLLQILIDLKDIRNYTIDEMAAQMFVFFNGGFEVAATTVTFALYELAKNPDIQDRLRQEVNETLDENNGEITYDILHSMKYLAQVFHETLRKYPPTPTLNRRCCKNYTLPGTDYVIQKGTPVLISCIGMHWDPEFYPDPSKFDPERFNVNSKSCRHPGVFLPFGDGPRNCIGIPFGKMQCKLSIVNVIKYFRVSLSDSMSPIEFSPYTFTLKTTENIYLKAEKI